jgi:ribulose-phosphate 3-epimerase
MLQCSTSLWSADLSNLGAEIRRVEPYSERFHLDVADGHYVPTLLFFPDQVKALRAHTKVPFEVHLMVTDPAAWIEPFVEAGTDVFIVCLDSTPRPAEVLQAIRAAGCQAGVSLKIRESIDLLEPLWPLLDLVTLIGTEVGIKGASMDPSIPDKIRRARAIVGQRGLSTLIQADGGIRRETVPVLAAAGADFIVPGSLMFKEDPASMRAWLKTL